MKAHEKIIKQTAKKILAPEGLFQVGRSRTWLEDNDYYLTVIGFQPSAYDRGSYLNVAVSFLWEYTGGLNEALCCGYSLLPYTPRVHEYENESGQRGLHYASYSGDDAKFEAEMEKLAEMALNRVREFRKFRDLSYARQALVRRVEEMADDRVFWEMYDLSLLCFFKGDYEDGMKYFHKYLEILKGCFWVGDCHIEWHEEFYHYCEDVLLPQCGTEADARMMVQNMINRRRKFFSDKPSYKGLKKMEGKESAL